jgi:hypothetical protein
MAVRKGCHEYEELPHLHLFIKGDCRTFEGPPFFTQSNPDCRIDKARVSDIKQAVKDRCGYEDGTPFQQSIWRGDFDIYWNGNKLDDDLFLEGISSEKSETSIKLEMYSTVNVVLRKSSKDINAADEAERNLRENYKAMNDADEAERQKQGGKKKTRKQIYSAQTRGIITLRKKGAKGRRKIERSRSFHNKR